MEQNLNCSSLKFYGPEVTHQSSTVPAVGKFKVFKKDELHLSVSVHPDSTIIQEIYNNVPEIFLLRLYRLETYPLPKHALHLYQNVTNLEMKAFMQDIATVFQFATQLPSLYRIIIGHAAICEGALDEQDPKTLMTCIDESASLKRSIVRLNECFYRESEERKGRINKRVKQIAFWLANMCTSLEMAEFTLPKSEFEVPPYKFRDSKIKFFDPPAPVVSPPMAPRPENEAPQSKKERRDRKRHSASADRESQQSSSRIPTDAVPIPAYENTAPPGQASSAPAPTMAEPEITVITIDDDDDETDYSTETEGGAQGQESHSGNRRLELHPTPVAHGHGKARHFCKSK